MNDRRAYLCTSLETVWNENILFDFTVKIEDKIFECHRLVLVMFSDFFAALFRSGMKEVNENSITLHDISPEVFHIIIELLYTDADLVTSENVIPVWRAAHQLQIPTIINLCEDFASTNITVEIWETMYNVAVCFQAESVLTNLHQFMLENFNEVCVSQTFLQLPFENIRDLIKNQDLVVSSEDLVMESVIRWVTCDPKVNNVIKDCNKETHEGSSMSETSGKNVMLDKIGARNVYLYKLLKKVRTCLVSSSLLTRVREMDFVMENVDYRDIIDYALSYNAKNFRHCQCPSAALTRSCSGYIHAGVFAKSYGWMKVISANTEKSFHINICNKLKDGIQLVTFDGKLYAAGHGNHPEGYRMYVFCGESWKQVKDMPSDNILLLSHGDFIYVLDKDDNKIYSMKPKTKRKYLNMLTEFPENICVEHAMFFQNVLLVYGSQTHNGFDKTVVYKLDILSNVWTRLNNLNGPAKRLISFKNDNHNYILQTNGSLRLLIYSSDTGNIKFEFLAKLWNFTKRLYGGITFRSKLIIFGNKPDTDPPEEKNLNEVPHHFKCISYLGTNDRYVSNFVPVTIRKTCLLKEASS